MKIVNGNIISFLGEIILTYRLEKEIIDKSFNYLENSNKLEKALSLFFNDRVMERIDKGENPEDFHPLLRLRLIIDDLINNNISYEDLPLLIKEKLGVSLLIANEISSSIEDNEDIKKLRNEEDTEEIEEYLDSKEAMVKEKTIGYELLK